MGASTVRRDERAGRPRRARRARCSRFDIGGTKLAAGVVDQRRSRPLLRRRRRPSRRAAPTTAAAAVRARAPGRRRVGHAVGRDRGGRHRLRRAARRGERRADRAAAPARAGATCRSSPLAEQALGRPATLENDATAAAAGEHRFGAGAGVAQHGLPDDLDRRRRRRRASTAGSTAAPTGNGGELGHVTVDWHGRPCRGCGRRGCLEAYVSGHVDRRARARGRASTGATAADVAAAARAGDPRRGRGLGRDRRGARLRRDLDRQPVRAGAGRRSAAASAAPASSCSGPCASACVLEAMARPAAGVDDRRRRARRPASASSARLRSLIERSAGTVAWLTARPSALAEHLERRGAASESCCRQVERRRRRAIIAAYEGGRRVYTFGNGGSAADAQHFAEELVGALQARAAAACRAVARDRSVGAHLHRQRLLVRRRLRAAGARARRAPGDVAIGFTTSGRSENVVRGLAAARERGRDDGALRRRRR